MIQWRDVHSSYMWWIVVHTGEGWCGVYSGLCEQ